MDMRAENGTQNGQGIAGDTVRVKPQEGALELARIVDALRAGQTPDAAAVAAVQALRPKSVQGNATEGVLGGREPAEVIDDLHSGDPERQRAAWTFVESLLVPDLVDVLKDRERTDWQKKAPPREWLIKGWLPRGRIGILSAEGGAGKSMLALQLAALMADGGGAWIGRAGDKLVMPDVAAGTVVFASWEDEADEIRRRLNYVEQAETVSAPWLGQDAPDLLTRRIDNRLLFLDMQGLGPLWAGDLTNSRAKETSAGEALRRYCETLDHAPDLLVLDSLAAAYGSGENERAQVREFMGSWDAWGRARDCAILIIHHPAKSGEGKEQGYSGNTDWHNASRWRWHLDMEGGPALRCAKASYGPVPEAVYLERTASTHWTWRVKSDQAPPPKVHTLEGGPLSGEEVSEEQLHGLKSKGFVNPSRASASKKGQTASAEAWRKVIAKYGAGKTRRADIDTSDL